METTIVHFPDPLRFTDEEFFYFCQNNPALKLERRANGDIVFMSLTGGKTGKFNSDLITELNIWNRQSNYGIVFDSSTGFRLPDSSIKSPDVALVATNRWAALTNLEQEKFVPLCPDFVVEIKSSTDRLKDAQQKMGEWIQNGCPLAWLLDIANQTAYVYKPSQPLQTIDFLLHGKLSDKNLLPGFELNVRLFQ